MKIVLDLKGYITPSPNETRWAHWSKAAREKKRAARALLCALHDILPDPLIPITFTARSNPSSIASAMLALLQMIQKRPSIYKSFKIPSRPAKNITPA